MRRHEDVIDAAFIRHFFSENCGFRDNFVPFLSFTYSNHGTTATSPTTVINNRYTIANFFACG